MDITEKDLALHHPFTCLIAGPTACGKSYFVKKLIANASLMIDPPPQKIIWCYGGEWQDEFVSFPNVEFVSGLNFPKPNPDMCTLLVIDDLMCQTDGRVTDIFVRDSHHQGISVIYLAQNLFYKGKEMRTISLNSHYIVVFKNARDKSQITHLAKQFSPGNTKAVHEAFHDATANAYGYLFFDFKPCTPNYLRMRTNIFPGENQIVYTIK